MSYLIPKPSLLKTSTGTVQAIAGGGDHAFLKSISPKVNARAQLTSYDFAVQLVSHYHTVIHTLYTRVSQRFCNILITWSTIPFLEMLLLGRSWKYRTTLDCEIPSLPDTLRVTLRIWQNSLEHGLEIYTFMPYHRGSCKPSEISLTIWLLYCDQLRLYF